MRSYLIKYLMKFSFEDIFLIIAGLCSIVKYFQNLKEFESKSHPALFLTPLYWCSLIRKLQIFSLPILKIFSLNLLLII